MYFIVFLGIHILYAFISLSVFILSRSYRTMLDYTGNQAVSSTHHILYLNLLDTHFANYPLLGFSFRPQTSSQIITWRLLISCECSAYLKLISGLLFQPKLTCFSSSTFCLELFTFLSFCIPDFRCFSHMAGWWLPRSLPKACPLLSPPSLLLSLVLLKPRVLLLLIFSACQPHLSFL